MKNSNQNQCPLCNSERSDSLFSLNSGVIDKSALYYKIKVKSCCECGHIFNELSEKECSNLSQYYEHEFSSINQNAGNVSTDLPGSSNPNTQKRYQRLIDMLPTLNSNNVILDVGCASGGLLKYLSNIGFSKLYGIDSADSYLEYSGEGDYQVMQGSAESIPHDSAMFDVVFLDQVLEHCVNPKLVFKEVRRVLKPGGFFCIGVPDTARYCEYFFFDYYWFLMKEHIQHFDIHHLTLLGHQESFDLIISEQNEMPVNAKMIQPNLNVVFKLIETSKQYKAESKLFEIKKVLCKYHSTEAERFAKRLDNFYHLISSRDKEIYFWGVSRELLLMLESLPSDLAGNYYLIDNNAFKQTQKYHCKTIYPPSLLESASKNSLLIATGVAHSESIINTVKGLGFLGEIYSLDKLDADLVRHETNRL